MSLDERQIEELVDRILENNKLVDKFADKLFAKLGYRFGRRNILEAILAGAGALGFGMGVANARTLITDKYIDIDGVRGPPFGLTWDEIKSKLETEGTKNKAYDSDVDGVFDVAAIPDLSRSKITNFFSSPFWDNIPDKPSPYSYDIPSSSYTVGAGAETTLLSVSGEGFVVVLYQGDGSADLRIRVYVDGSLDDEFPCNETRVGAYAFTSSIEIRLYNPSASDVTSNCPTANVRGWVR